MILCTLMFYLSLVYALEGMLTNLSKRDCKNFSKNLAGFLFRPRRKHTTYCFVMVLASLRFPKVRKNLLNIVMIQKERVVVESGSKSDRLSVIAGLTLRLKSAQQNILF